MKESFQNEWNIFVIKYKQEQTYLFRTKVISNFQYLKNVFVYSKLVHSVLFHFMNSYIVVTYLTEKFPTLRIHANPELILEMSEIDSAPCILFENISHTILAKLKLETYLWKREWINKMKSHCFHQIVGIDNFNNSKWTNTCISQ